MSKCLVVKGLSKVNIIRGLSLVNTRGSTMVEHEAGYFWKEVRLQWRNTEVGLTF